MCVNYIHNRESADALVGAIERAGGRAIAVAADVASESEVILLFESVDKKLGPITALVNNAGILEQQTRLENTSAARLNRIFSTNITGCFLRAREAVRRMSTKRGGAGGTIVNLSSFASRLGSPGNTWTTPLPKAPLSTMTIGLAKQVAEEGIRVNAVRPDFIYTDIHASGGEPNRVDRVKELVPMKRGGTPVEVAKAILWLLSDEASYTTEVFIDVTGGK